MTSATLSRDDVRAAAASAVLLNLAYPPFHLVLPSLLCLAPVIVALGGERGQSTARRQVFLGFLFGLLAHALLLHWMAVALWRYQPWSVLGYLATVLWLAGGTGVVFAAAGQVCRRTGLPLVLVFPVMWTSMEWLLAHQGPAAYTWLGLGTSLTGYPVAVQVADVIGARGVTFLLATANAALATAWTRRSQRRRAGRLVTAVVLGCLVVVSYGVIRIRTIAPGTVARVAVVQTDIAAGEKWNPASSDSIVGQALMLSRAAADQRPELIVWPETALPGALLYHPEWTRALRATARSASAFLLVGGIDAIPTGRALDQYNAAFLVPPDGRPMDAPYRKRRLVPLFERGNGIVEGAHGVTYTVPHGRIGVLICGEVTFESLARRYRREGADALVNLSNDAWFAAGTGSQQHAAHLVMRAIETRMGIARAANYGVSEMVDPLGRVRHRLPVGEPGALVGLLGTSASMPPYVLLGDWVGLLSGALAVTGLTLSAVRRPRGAES